MVPIKQINWTKLKQRTTGMFVVFCTGELCQYGLKKEYQKEGETYIGFVLFPDPQLWKYPEFNKKFVIVKEYLKKHTRILKEDIDFARIIIYETPEGKPTKMLPEERKKEYDQQIMILQKTIDGFTERNSTLKKILESEKKKLRLSISRDVDAVNEASKAKKKITKESLEVSMQRQISELEATMGDE